MHDLQVALDRDAHQVDHRSVYRAPEKVFAEYDHAQPVPEPSRQTDAAKLRREYRHQQDAAAQVEHVLVENQQLPPVLFRGDHRVEDERVGRCAHDSDDHDRALEIETGSTPRRRRSVSARRLVPSTVVVMATDRCEMIDEFSSVIFPYVRAHGQQTPVLYFLRKPFLNDFCRRLLKTLRSSNSFVGER